MGIKAVSLSSSRKFPREITHLFPDLHIAARVDVEVLDPVRGPGVIGQEAVHVDVVKVQACVPQVGVGAGI